MRYAMACVVALTVGGGVLAGPVRAQVGVLDKDARAAYSPLWAGERFHDGRPKVPDDFIARLRLVSLEEAWGVLRRHGYHNTPGEIDMKWTEDIEQDFLAWVGERRDELTEFQRRKFLGAVPRQ